jgi:acyl-CoA dehydrogenase
MEELFWGLRRDRARHRHAGARVVGHRAGRITGADAAVGAPECFGTPGDLKLAALAISEPESGSDVRNLRTRARPLNR